jgi:hypothetical protein
MQSDWDHGVGFRPASQGDLQAKKIGARRQKNAAPGLLCGIL